MNYVLAFLVVYVYFVLMVNMSERTVRRSHCLPRGEGDATLSVL